MVGSQSLGLCDSGLGDGSLAGVKTRRGFLGSRESRTSCLGQFPTFVLHEVSTFCVGFLLAVMKPSVCASCCEC